MTNTELIASRFDSIDSVINYLRESSPSEVVSSTATSTIEDSTQLNNELKLKKRQQKEKDSAIVTDITKIDADDLVEILSSGRVRYGPITVNPRKKPSKTLLTGRRSKYETLFGDEEEKRRTRRERNRIAATKCREKRENILDHLEKEFKTEENHYNNLIQTIQQLEERRKQLQSILSNHNLNCQLKQIDLKTSTHQSSMIFGDIHFLSSITETSAPRPLPPHQLQIISNDEEERNHFYSSASLLTNSAYNDNQLNTIFNSDHQFQQQTMTMKSSSFERILNNLHSPSVSTDNNNNNNNACAGLYNSAYGISSCAQQHSNSSEDDSLPLTHQNSFVF